MPGILQTKSQIQKYWHLHENHTVQNETRLKIILKEEEEEKKKEKKKKEKKKKREEKKRKKKRKRKIINRQPPLEKTQLPGREIGTIKS